MCKENFLYFLKWLIFALIICLFNFYLVFGQAQAYELVYPNNQLDYNGTTYYGYDIPTRATGTDSLGPNVRFSSTMYNPDNQHYVPVFTDKLKLYLRDLPDYVVDKLKNANDDYKNYFDVPTVWSSTYTSDKFSYHSCTIGTACYWVPFTYGFDMGQALNTQEQVLENGFGIYYDAIYSYTFDVVIYNSNGLNSSRLDLQPYFINYNDVTHSYTCIKYDSRYYQGTVVYSDDYVKYVRYDVKFNQYTFGIGFANSFTEDETSMYGVKGDNIFANSGGTTNQYGIYQGDTIIFSQPYNITMWSTTNTLTCTDRCWTQEDTNNNQRLYNDTSYMWNNMSDIVDNFDYYGFGGIVNLTYDYIISLLQDNTCPLLNVPVLSTSFNLPSSCSFWNRNDVSTFKELYEMVWLGLVSYYVCWRVFKDILRLYEPNSSVIEGNEVADL